MVPIHYQLELLALRKHTVLLYLSHHGRSGDPEAYARLPSFTGMTHVAF